MIEIVDRFAHAQQMQALKGLAWRLRTAGGGKHAAMLEATSKAAGYANWWEALNRPRAEFLPFEEWLSRVLDVVNAEVVESLSRDELQNWHARTFPDLRTRGSSDWRQLMDMHVGGTRKSALLLAAPATIISYKKTRRSVQTTTGPSITEPLQRVR